MVEPRISYDVAATDGKCLLKENFSFVVLKVVHRENLEESECVYSKTKQ